MNRFSQIEYEQRWQRVLTRMHERGHGLALVWGKTAGSYERSGDLLYLSNFYSTQSGQEPDSPLWNARSFAAVVLEPGGVPELHVDDGAANLEALPTDRVHAHFDVIAGVAQALKQRGDVGPVAMVGSDFLPVKYMRQLETLCPGTEFIFDDDLVREVRKIKSSAELDCYREGGAIAASALNILIENLVTGKTQAEAAAAAGFEMTRQGASWRRMIMNHGDQLERLEREPLSGLGHDAPKPTDFVRGWVDGIFEGYWLDPGRTAVCGGAPSAEQKRIVETTVGICEQLREHIRPGVKVMEVALLGDQLVADSGYGENRVQESWPYYGHGLGCMWEPPLIEKRCCTSEETFEAGMVLGVECFLGAEQLGIVGYEDNFIVTESGTEIITPARQIWW